MPGHDPRLLRPRHGLRAGRGGDGARRPPPGGGARLSRLVEFGFVAAPVAEPGTPDAPLYGEILADCEHHAALGYTTAWMIEHHFSDYFPTPSPLTYLAFIAGRFPQLGLGTCVLVTPWYDPVRLAEEIAMLTHLTERPIHLGLGRGTATYEYEAFGLDMNDARDHFREAWEVIDLALTGEPFAYAGAHVRVPKEIRLRPRPARERLHLYGAVVSDASAPIMAGLGLAPICTSIGDLAKQAAVLRVWEDAAAAGGHETSPHRVIMITTIVEETDEEALAQARRYVPRYMQAQVDHYRASEVEIARVRGYEAWARTFARWQELCDPAAIDGWTEGQLVGSPATVRERLQGFLDAGFDHVIVHTSTPGVPRADRHRWAELFAREVAPAFGRASARP